MTATHFFVPLAFVVGLLFGSFLNVCIARLPAHESIVHPRSKCTHCGHPIRWYDNIPLLSWLVLRARCRDCRAHISWRYPAVELAVGLWFARYLGACIYGAYEFNFINPDGLHGWLNVTHYAIEDVGIAILGFLLIGLLVMDWRTHRLPDAFTLPGIGIGFFLVCVQAIFLAPGEDDVKLNPAHSLRMSSPGSFVAKGNVFLTGPEHLVFGRLAAIVGAALTLLCIRWAYRAIRKQDGLGLGDVKLLAMIAAFLGWWPAVLALFLGCILTLPYAAYLLLTKRAVRSSALPFGSFLCAGGLLAALFGERWIAWYTSLL